MSPSPPRGAWFSSIDLSYDHGVQRGTGKGKGVAAKGAEILDVPAMKSESEVYTLDDVAKINIFKSFMKNPSI